MFTGDYHRDTERRGGFEAWLKQLRSAKSFEEYSDTLEQAPAGSDIQKFSRFVIEELLPSIHGQIESPLPAKNEHWTPDEIMDGERYKVYILARLTDGLEKIFQRTVAAEGKVVADEYTELAESIFHRALRCYRERVRRSWQEYAELVAQGLSGAIEEGLDPNVFGDYQQDSYLFIESQAQELACAEEKVVERLIELSAEHGIAIEPALILEALRTLPMGSITIAAADYFKRHPRESVRTLLQSIRSPEESTHNKAVFTRVLDKIEPAEIEIQKNIVEMWGRPVRLDMAQAPEGGALRRISGDGGYGVFSKEGALVAYVDGQQLLEEASTVVARPITPDMLYAQKKTEAHSVEQFLTGYTVFTKELKDRAGRVRLSDLSLREQFWLFQFWQNDGTKRDQIENIQNKFGVEGLKTFISLEQDPTIHTAILDIAQAPDTATVRLIFQKYSQLVEAAEGVGDYVQAKFKTKKLSGSGDVRRIVEGLLERGKNLIVDSAHELAAQASAEPAATEHLMAQLNAVRADILLFASTFKIASEQQSLEFGDIEGVSLIHKDSSALTAVDQQAMVEIFTANRANNAKAYPSAWLKKRVAEFTTLLQGAGKQFSILKNNGEVVAFLHTEPQGDAVYLGSFNVAKEGRGNRIGAAFLEATLDQVGRSAPVEIVVNAQNSWFDQYQKKFGFKVVEKISNYKNTGLEYAVMVRPAAVKKKENYAVGTEISSAAA